MFIPSILLRQLYTHGSLTQTEDGLQFMLKNRLKDATLNQVESIAIDGEVISPDAITLQVGPEEIMSMAELNESGEVPFALKQAITVYLNKTLPVSPEKHTIELIFKAAPFGKLKFSVEDNVSAPNKSETHIPRDPHDDYSPGIIDKRQ